MADVLLILAGPAVALALVVGYVLGRRSNVDRRVAARFERELAHPLAAPVTLGADISRDGAPVIAWPAEDDVFAERPRTERVELLNPVAGSAEGVA